MASIAFRNSSRRLLRAYFSKLGWQANVIWRIAFFNQLQVYPSWLWRSDLFRASLKVSRGVHLERFGNGNGHLHFEPDTLRDINMVLAEFYGDVLPDDSEEKPDARAAGTAVSKDLQYYPTPESIVERVVEGLYGLKDQRILEPSCGCG